MGAVRGHMEFREEQEYRARFPSFSPPSRCRTEGHHRFGMTRAEPSLDRHWDPERAKRGERALFADVAFDTLLNPEMGDEPLWTKSSTGRAGQVHWNTQSSGIQISPRGDDLEHLWSDHLRRIRPNDVGELPLALEGAVKLSLQRHRSRESWIRDKKIHEAMRRRREASVRGSGLCL